AAASDSAPADAVSASTAEPAPVAGMSEAPVFTNSAGVAQVVAASGQAQTPAVAKSDAPPPTAATDDEVDPSAEEILRQLDELEGRAPSRSKKPAKGKASRPRVEPVANAVAEKAPS